MVKTGCLYLLHRDGKLELMDEGFRISNGLGMSPDGRTLYFADSGSRVVYAYDVAPDSGRLAGRRVFFRAGDAEGLPDGLTVDCEGLVWTALWYGGEVVRVDPDGAVERRIRFPALQVSSVAFGGDELCDLYVTSASRYWPSPHSPPGIDPAARMGGALYRVRADVRGRRENLTRLHVPEGQKT
jgi:sugar lactone lactonase YvrE